MYVRLAFAALRIRSRNRSAGRGVGRLLQAGQKGFAIWEKRKPNFDCGPSLGRGLRGIPKKCLGKMKDVADHGRTILWN